MKKYTFDQMFRNGLSLFPELDHKEYYEQEFVTVKDLKKELQWCMDWLDVGDTRKEMENQAKILMKLSELIDNLDANCVKPALTEEGQ